ncbi:hypothetical protein CPB86DRAFT_522838 [Serendipita vermifera]|nr:hypothetical protein CPB86DRAFT_522838 [Serendipita vermifera]
MLPANSLPIELFIHIITAALDTSSRDEFVKVGHNAAWKAQRPSPIGIMAIQHTRPHTPVEDTLPFPNGVNEAHSEANNLDYALTSEQDDARRQYFATAQALRLVNRVFNQIATTLLFRDVNLLYGIENIPRVERILQEIVLPHAQHTRSLWVFADTVHGHLSAELDTFTANLLRNCPRLESLGLYFHWNAFNQDWPELRGAILSLMEEGNLSRLGFYSEKFLAVWGNELTYPTVHKLIQCISQSERARNRLKCVDMAVISVSLPTSALIRSRFPNLESLTIRSGLDEDIGTEYWGPCRGHIWESYQRLTRLQLYKCKYIHALHIPEFVKTFPALK